MRNGSSGVVLNHPVKSARDRPRSFDFSDAYAAILVGTQERDPCPFKTLHQLHQRRYVRHEGPIRCPFQPLDCGKANTRPTRQFLLVPT